MRGRVTYRAARQSDGPVIFDVLRSANFHRVPSPEMPDFDLGRAFVAEHEGGIVGVAGYKLEAPGRCKTTLMAVYPRCRGLGIGQGLQELRLAAMHRLGCRAVVTNADLPETISWYKRRFGYREVGSVRKLHEFGAAHIHAWTTLEMDIERWLGTLSRERLDELTTWGEGHRDQPGLDG